MSANPNQGPAPRLPLVAPLEARSNDPKRDPKLFNAYAERDETGNFRVYQRQGISRLVTIASPPTGLLPLGQYFSGSTQYSGGFLSAFAANIGNTIYYNTGNAGGWSTFGVPVNASAALFTGAIQWSISSLEPNTNFAIAAGRFAKYGAFSGPVNITPPAGIADVVKGLASLDSTIYCMDNLAFIWGSNLNDPTTWNALNNIPASGIPGAGIAIARHQSYIVAFKTRSVEFFYDAQNPVGSPLLAVPNSIIRWGCFSGESVQDIEGELFWVAQSDQASVFVARLSNGHPKKISTPGVDRLLDDVTGSTVPAFSSFAFKDSGHTFYGFTAQAINLTLVYDIGQDIWYVWTDTNGNFWPWFSTVTGPDSTVYVQPQGLTTNAIASALYTLDEEFVTDNNSITNSLIPVDIYTANWDGGTRRKKTLMRMDFLADQGPGVLQVRSTEDDFQTYSQWRYVDLNQKRPTLTNCGTFRRRAWHMHYASPHRLRMEAVELDALQGGA